jgi:hypothetical protein
MRLAPPVVRSKLLLNTEDDATLRSTVDKEGWPLDNKRAQRGDLNQATRPYTRNVKSSHLKSSSSNFIHARKPSFGPNSKPPKLNILDIRMIVFGINEKNPKG